MDHHGWGDVGHLHDTPRVDLRMWVVVVHPDDARHAHLVGRTVELPLDVEGRTNTVEIRTHPSVKMDFGSGILMVCSFGDQNDVAVFRELGLDPFQAIGVDGRMTSIAGPLAGLTVMEARASSIDALEAAGRLVARSDRDQEVPVSERGKNPVEIILLREWYVRQTHVQERMRELIEDIEFHPPRNRQFLTDWMANITIDWPISRRRWYHTEIPIWYADEGRAIVTPPRGVYVHPLEARTPQG